MRLTVSVLISVFFVLAIATGGSAFAEDLFSFTYSDLDGDYDAGSMLFTAADDDLTDGDVTRIISPTGTAFFSGSIIDGGFPDFASFSLETTLANITATTASLVPGGGFLELRDVDDDVIAANVFWGVDECRRVGQFSRRADQRNDQYRRRIFQWYGRQQLFDRVSGRSAV